MHLPHIILYKQTQQQQQQKWNAPYIDNPFNFSPVRTKTSRFNPAIYFPNISLQNNKLKY